MNRAALSRADLIRWAATLDDGQVARLAALFGYEPEPQAPAEPQQLAPDGSDHLAPGTPTVTPQATTPRHRQYALTGRQVIAPPPPTPAPLPPPPTTPVVRLGPPPPLVPWSRLWPFLHAALGEMAERRPIDLMRLTTAAARLRTLRRLPRLKARRWAPRGQLLLDLSPRLYPFWNDFHDLKDQLARLRGPAGLTVLRLDRGPEGLVQPWVFRSGADGGGWGLPRPYAPPPAGTPVLIAGDLGCLGSAAERAPWVRLGQRLARRGCRPAVLTPCPPDWWDPELAGLYFPVTLERTGPIPPRPAGPRPWPAPAPERAAAVRAAIRADAGAELLLSLLSACIAITPPLLRHLRHHLPAGLVRVGSEAACWQHPAFLGGDLPLVPGNADAIERLRRAFPTVGTPDQRALAWALILAQQDAVGASVAVRMEERALHAAMLGGTDDAAETFLNKVGDTLLRTRERRAAADEQRLIGWVDRRTARSHREVWTFSPATHRLRLLAHPEAERAGAVNPDGFDIHRALAAAGRPRQIQSWRLMQRGDRLEWEPTAAPAGAIVSGSPVIAEMPTDRPVIAAQEQRAGAPWMSLGLDPAADGAGALPLGEHGWRLRTDFEELLITPMPRPAWAQTLGRDQDGLFVGFAAGQGERRAYWCAPLEWLRWPGSPVDPAVDSPWDGHGAFVDADQFKALRLVGLIPPGAGWTLRRDQYGLRGEISIKGVAIGLRWIWPGAFQMGSPPGEEGRFDDETQHEVILTRGFWLAETACTQALWEAVMGENPSHAKGPQLPVEQVSWTDIQAFIERLNTWLDGAVERSVRRTQGFRLPTEAEWEYACRAGTTTAYSFGDVFDSKKANNGGAATVAVRSLPANDWGFYEMHGNVYEWCQDWFGNYPAGSVIDPAGADSGGGRVLRGGSWLFDARFLRSASRVRDDPGHRGHFIGFRLALGPEPGQVGTGQPAGSGAGQPAQGASGSERKARAVRPRGGKGGAGA